MQQWCTGTGGCSLMVGTRDQTLSKIAVKANHTIDVASHVQHSTSNVLTSKLHFAHARFYHGSTHSRDEKLGVAGGTRLHTRR